MGDPAGARPVGADHADPSLGRTSPHRHLEPSDCGDHVLGRVRKAELRKLREGSLDLGPGTELEGAILAGHLAPAADRRFGDPASLLPGLAEQRGVRRGRAELLDRRQAAVPVVGVARPGLERLLGAPQPAAQHLPLEPVDARWRRDSRGAQVSEQVRCPPPSDGGLEQGDQARPGDGPGHGQIGLRGGRDREARENPAIERAGGSRIAQHDRDLPGWDSVVEQPRHLGSDRLHLGELSGRGEQRQPAVVRDRVALDRGLAESALELEQGVAPGEPRLGLQLLNRHPFDIPELGEERPLASVRTARSSQGRAQVTGAVRDSSRISSSCSRVRSSNP